MDAHLLLERPKVIWLLIAASAGLYLSCVLSISYPLTTLLKPLPIALLILLVAKSECDIQHRGFLTFALTFALCGDIALTLPLSHALDAGIVFFLLCHWCYIFLFFRAFHFQLKGVIGFIPVLLTVLFFYLHLLPYLGRYETPLTVYFFVLTLMIFSTFQMLRFVPLLAFGAILFLISDLIIVYNIFLFKTPQFTLLTMSTYYLAQCCLIAGSMKHFKENLLHDASSTLSQAI